MNRIDIFRQSLCSKQFLDPIIMPPGLTQHPRVLGQELYITSMGHIKFYGSMGRTNFGGGSFDWKLNVQLKSTESQSQFSNSRSVHIVPFGMFNIPHNMTCELQLKLKWFLRYTLLESYILIVCFDLAQRSLQIVL